MLHCPACSHDNPDHAKFCAECGARLPQGCASCGATLTEGARFCLECGTAVGAAPATPRAAPLPTAFVNGRYTVSRFLGEGGKKRVYLCRDTRLARDVAFSVIKTDGLDTTSIERIEREAQVMARLGDHPHIVALFDIGEDAGQPYLVSQLMQGGDVEGLIASAPEHRLPLADTLRIADQVCQALVYAHEHGVVHRDLKPGNVWLTKDGAAKLGDFGLAMSIDKTRLSIAGMIVGTVAYMPPEQALGKTPDARSDLYSLGAMLYEMVTGRPPFLGDDPVAVISQHVNTPPVAPSWHSPTVPKPLEALILRLLAKDPQQRPASAADVRSELASIAPIDARPTTAELAQQEANPLDRLAGGVFVGRERELDAARATLDGALAGRGQVLLVVGEPGIGKTRLVEEVGTYASVRGAQVLWGRCYEWEGAPAYWPWVQLIRSYVHESDPQALRSELGQGAADVANVVSDIREHLPGLPDLPSMDPEQARFRLFDSITTFLKNAARRQPLMLVLDDLHWADRPSLLLLEFIARELGRDRLLLVGTYRDVEVGRQHPLSQTLAELSRGRTGQRVLLRGLPRDDVGRFIALNSGSAPPEPLVDAVYRETEGNPFFVAEVVRLLVAEGRLERPEAGANWSVSIPESVREVVGKRLNRLSLASNQVLALAAVIGREFRLATLQLVTGRSRDELLDLLEEALRARLIEEQATVETFRFTHALVQETLYQELSTARRVRLHGQVGDAIERLHAANPTPYLGELAQHYFEAASSGYADQAIEYAVRAGDRAMEQLAWEAAALHYEQALQVLDLLPAPDEQRACAVLLKLGKAKWLSGSVEDGRVIARRAAEIARRNRMFTQFAEAALGFSGWWGGGSTFSFAAQESISLLDEALRLLPFGDSVLRSVVEATLSHYLIEEIGDHTRALELSDSSLQMAVRINEVESLLWVLVKRYVILSGMADKLAEERAIVDNFSQNYVNHVDSYDSAALVGADTLLSVMEGEGSGFGLEFSAAYDTILQSRLPQQQFYAVLRRSIGELVNGKFADADQSLDQTLALGRVALPGDEADNWVGMFRFVLRREQGRLAELDHLVAQWGLSAAPRSAGLVSWIWQFIAALHSWERGRPDQARAIVERQIGPGLTSIPREQTWLGNMAVLAELSVAFGDRERAAELYELLEPFANRVVLWSSLFIPLDPVAYYLGLLGTTLENWSDAERHFEHAIAMSERMSAPPWAAHARYAYADMLVKRAAPDDREQALALLDQALSTAEEIGMVRLAGLALTLKVRVQGILKA